MCVTTVSARANRRRLSFPPSSCDWRQLATHEEARGRGGGGGDTAATKERRWGRGADEWEERREKIPLRRMQAERAKESLSNSAQRNGMEKKHSTYFLPFLPPVTTFFCGRGFFSLQTIKGKKRNPIPGLSFSQQRLYLVVAWLKRIFFSLMVAPIPPTPEKKNGRGWVCRPSGSSSNRLGGGPQAVTDDRSQDETSPSSFFLSSSLAELFPVFSVCVGSPPPPPVVVFPLSCPKPFFPERLRGGMNENIKICRQFLEESSCPFFCCRMWKKLKSQLGGSLPKENPKPFFRRKLRGKGKPSGGH